MYVGFTFSQSPLADLTRIDKRFYRPASIDRWIVVVYERQQRFNQQAAQDMIDGLLRSCSDVGELSWLVQVHFSNGLLPGMRVNDTSPLVTWQNGQGRIAEVKFSMSHTYGDDRCGFVATTCSWKRVFPKDEATSNTHRCRTPRQR